MDSAAEAEPSSEFSDTDSNVAEPSEINLRRITLPAIAFPAPDSGVNSFGLRETGWLSTI